MLEMAHVPKRATQHGLFLPGAEAPVVSLKPGQQELERRGFYTTEAKALEETYLSQDQFNESIYAKAISHGTLPVDYEDPQKPTQKRNAAATAGTGGHMGTGHWRSEYRGAYESDSLTQVSYKRQHGPPFETQAPPACVSQPNELSFYQQEFGVYGSDPRTRIPKDASRVPVEKTDLTRGTTKGTAHIPGYQGYIPTNTNNSKVKSIESGEQIREVSKSNLVDIYHLNIPGYAGTVPTNAKNDKGPRQISTMTVTGKDYSSTAGLAF